MATPRKRTTREKSVVPLLALPPGEHRHADLAAIGERLRALLLRWVALYEASVRRAEIAIVEEPDSVPAAIPSAESLKELLQVVALLERIEQLAAGQREDAQDGIGSDLAAVRDAVLGADREPQSP